MKSEPIQEFRDRPAGNSSTKRMRTKSTRSETNNDEPYCRTNGASSTNPEPTREFRDCPAGNSPTKRMRTRSISKRLSETILKNPEPIQDFEKRRISVLKQLVIRNNSIGHSLTANSDSTGGWKQINKQKEPRARSYCFERYIYE